MTGGLISPILPVREGFPDPSHIMSRAFALLRHAVIPGVRLEVLISAP